MASTERGTRCPTCESGRTEVVSIIPRVKGDQVINAGEWSCCMACYREQWATVYGPMFGGISYDEYVKNGCMAVVT